HRRAWREHARAVISHFAEVQIACPPEVARERERTRPPTHSPRDIYERAGRPGATVPGIDVAYEPAYAPELVTASARAPLAQAAHRTADLGIRLAASTEAPPLRQASWAIWLTGRPGSGKTTVASHVCQGLVARGVPVRVLNIDEVRRLLPGDSLVSVHELEIMHLSLAYAAKLLTESGVALLVDATAPRRAWRSTARALIPCFAEIQVLCPTDICVERHRTWRWGLGAWSSPPGRASGSDAGPDLAGDYEEPIRPELTLRTDVH